MISAPTGTPFQRARRFTCLGAILALWLLGLLMPSLAGASVEAPVPESMPDQAEIIVSDTWVKGFFLLNNNVIYSKCFGDIGNYTSELRIQPIDDPTSNTSLITLPDCERFNLLQGDPTGVYYKNEPDQTIERRLLHSPSTVTVLATYASFSEPVAMQLADGYLYWAAKDDKVRRVSTFGGMVDVVIDGGIGEPGDMAIDDFYIWVATETGIHRVDRDCIVPCNPYQQRTGLIKKVFGASTGSLPGEVSVFWVQLGATVNDPDTVESWDGNIPGSGGIRHSIHRTATLGSIDAVIATDDAVWWLEKDEAGVHQGQLRRIGRGVDENPPSVLSEIMDNAVQPSGWLPGRLQFYNDHLFYRSNGITRIHQDSDPLVWDFDVLHMEVTQGQQNLESDGELVAGKRTFVRVYAEQNEGLDVAYLEVKLEGFGASGGPLAGSPLAPIISPAKMSTGVPFDRANTDTTWLFELPPEWIGEGEIRLEATVDPRHMYDQTPVGLVMDSWATFHHMWPACLVAISVDVHGPDASRRDPEWTHAVDQAADMLPTGGLWRYYQSGRLREGFIYYGPYELPSDKALILSDLWWRNVWSDDPDDCNDAGGNAHYVGLVHPEASTGSAIGRAYSSYLSDELWIKLPAKAGPPTGWPVQQRSAILGHELLHNYGRQHVNCGGGLSNPDPNYPGDPCHLAQVPTALGDYWGFEPRTKTPIGPTMAKDVMTYSSPEWVSQYTWAHVYDLLYPHRRAEEETTLTPDSALVIIAGHINVSDPSRSSLNHTWVMPTTTLSRSMREKWTGLLAAEYRAGPLADYHVQLLNSHNTVLADHVVTPVRTDDHDGSGALRHFGLTVPEPHGVVAKVRLLYGATTLETVSPGSTAPTLRVLEPARNATIDQELTVRWESYDTDGDQVHFQIQYSADDGSTWQTLAANFRGDDDVGLYEITVDASFLPGSQLREGRVRIAASDGYHTTVDTSDGFTVASRAPEAMISWPPDGHWHEAGEVVSLEGWATDAEDGRLSGSSLRWTVNSGSQGGGDTKQIAGLAPGTYDVTLRARDRDFDTGTAEATFHVSPLEIARGRAKLDGRCNDVDYANGPLIMLEPYADGSQARVTLLRDGEYYWACFSGLKNAGVATHGSYAGIRLDGNLSQHPLAQSNDYAFFVYQDGHQVAWQGDGAGGFSSATPSWVSYSLATFARLNPDGNTWNAELRINIATSGVGEHIGIGLGHYWVDAQGDDYHWPYDLVWNAPDSWAESYFDTVPKLLALTPYTVTLPVALGTITLTGENFENGDEVLWDGSPLPLTLVLSPTEISQIVGSTLLTAGDHEVRVRRGGTDIVSNPLSVTVFNPPATIDHGPYPTELIQGATGASFQVFSDAAVPGVRVYMDGKPLTTLYQGLGWIEAYPSAEDLRHPGTKQITLRNAEPVAQMSNAVLLTVASCGLVGDFDNNLVVDVSDVVTVADRWGEFGTPYDLDGDNLVTIADIMLTAGGFGDRCP